MVTADLFFALVKNYFRNTIPSKFHNQLHGMREDLGTFGLNYPYDTQEADYMSEYNPLFTDPYYSHAPYVNLDYSLPYSHPFPYHSEGRFLEHA